MKASKGLRKEMEAYRVTYGSKSVSNYLKDVGVDARSQVIGRQALLDLSVSPDGRRCSGGW